jgi:hypothetical protein
MPIVRQGVFLVFLAVGCGTAVKGPLPGWPWIPKPQQIDQLAFGALFVCLGGAICAILRRRRPFCGGGVPQLGGGDAAPNLWFLVPLLLVLPCVGVLWRGNIWAKITTLIHVH